MEKLLIDIAGTGLGIFVIFAFFESYWGAIKTKKYIFAFSILLLIVLNVTLTIMLQNVPILPLLSVATTFILSLFFYSKITSKLLLTLAVSAIMFASEMLIAFILVQLLGIALEQLQTDLPLYMLGMIASKLFALLFVFTLRMFVNRGTQNIGRQFNLLMGFMPIQSIILCYIVFDYSVRTDATYHSPLGSVAVLFSVMLILITIFVLNRQQKAMLYKNEYEISQAELTMQIEHYQELYKEQQEVKQIRHEINNKLVAISGALVNGQVQEALNKINNMQDHIMNVTYTINTGLPPIDAIISAKIIKAKEVGVEIKYNIVIDGELYIDQFDIASIVANALDNAVEGVQRSVDVDRTVILDIIKLADYISIHVVNGATGPVYDDLQSSKPNKKKHGFGIPQMKIIVKKYDGSFMPLYEQNEKRFTLKILLKNIKI